MVKEKTTKKVPKKEKEVKKKIPKKPKKVLEKEIRVIAPEVPPPEVKEKAPEVPKAKVKKEARVVYYGIGRRKTSRAVVFLSPAVSADRQGEGRVFINRKPLKEYFLDRNFLEELILLPFKTTDTLGKYDVEARVSGGGITSQAGAVKLGIARALASTNPLLRNPLRTSDALRRDPRMKERKKYGRKRARRRFQYTKR